MSISAKTKDKLTYLLSALGILVSLILISLNIKAYLSQKRVLAAETQDEEISQLKKEASFWEGFLSQNPTYLPGWLELSKIEYELGDEDYALGALNTARAINPNSEKVKEFTLPTFQSR